VFFQCAAATLDAPVDEDFSDADAAVDLSVLDPGDPAAAARVVEEHLFPSPGDYRAAGVRLAMARVERAAAGAGAVLEAMFAAEAAEAAVAADLDAWLRL
jgi:hypothetical protein